MYRSVMDNQDLEPDFSKVPDHVIAPCDAMVNVNIAYFCCGLEISRFAVFVENHGFV